MDHISQLKAAKNKSTPIVALASPDQVATAHQLTSQVWKDSPIVVWDIARGAFAGNEAGEMLLESCLLNAKGIEQEDTRDPATFLRMIWLAKDYVVDNAVYMMYNAQRLIVDHLEIIQYLNNLRDPFKNSRNMLLLLGPYMILPRELIFDVVLIEEELPEDEELKKLVTRLHTCNDVNIPDEKYLNRAAEAVRGLSPFAADQVMAMAITREGLNFDNLWSFKKRIIRQSKGLDISTSDLSFMDVGGLGSIKNFLTKLFNGPQPPSLIVFIDEIDKCIAGTHGSDAHSVDKDQLGVFLQVMQDNNWTGCVLIGPPGVSKSHICKAAGGEFGVPTIRLDMNGMKDSLVGSSEQAIRESMRIIKGVGGKNVLFLATCNRINDLPPELIRRFRLGTWFFDLPSDEELKSIWSICMSKYNHDFSQKIPCEVHYTGADVENICETAYRMNCSLVDACKYISPVVKTSPDLISNLRSYADGKFLSSAYEGVFTTKTKKEESLGRKLDLEA